MSSYQLIFAFIFVIKVAINIVPSSAANRPPSPPDDYDDYQSEGDQSPLAPYVIPPSAHGRPARPPSIHSNESLEPNESFPPTPQGSPPHGHGPSSVPPSRSRSVPPSRSGSRPPSYRGSGPPSPYGPGALSPYGERALAPHDQGALTPVREAPPPRANKERGEFSFGFWDPHERPIHPDGHVCVEQPDFRFVGPVGTHTVDVMIPSPTGERITRIEFISKQGIYSDGEQVQIVGHTRNADLVQARIWSKRHTNIDFIVKYFTHH